MQSAKKHCDKTKQLARHPNVQACIGQSRALLRPLRMIRSNNSENATKHIARSSVETTQGVGENPTRSHDKQSESPAERHPKRTDQSTKHHPPGPQPTTDKMILRNQHVRYWLVYGTPSLALSASIRPPGWRVAPCCPMAPCSWAANGFWRAATEGLLRVLLTLLTICRVFWTYKPVGELEVNTGRLAAGSCGHGVELS